MFYIFNKDGKMICHCDNMPDDTDLLSRDEFFVESEELNGHLVYNFTNHKIDVLPTKPSTFHKWNGSEWIINKELERQVMPMIDQRQFRLTLLEYSITEASVTKKVKASEDKDVLLIEWQYSTYFKRTSENVIKLFHVIGIDTDDAIDDFWNKAKEK